jgi:hypothetical protein
VPAPLGSADKGERRRPWDRLRYVDVADFSGGLDDTIDTPALPPGFGRVVRNVHWRRRRLEKRGGSVKIGQTLRNPANTANLRVLWIDAYRNIEDGTQQYMCIGGDGSANSYLFFLDEADVSASPYGTWKGAVSRALTGGLPDATDRCGGGVNKAAVRQYNNRLWITDQDEAWRYTEDPTPEIQAWSFASTLPDPTLDALIAGGQLTNPGNYQIKYTYFDPLTGDESNASAASNVKATSAANEKCEFTVPLNANWTPNYSQVKIYRTKADGVTYFLERTIGTDVDPIVDLDTVDLDPTHGTFGAECYIEVLDSALGDSTAPTANLPVTPALHILLFEETFILYGFEDDYSKARYCPAGRPWAWPALNFVEVNQRDGQRLRTLQAGFHQVVALKDRSAHLLARDVDFGFTREEIPQHSGLASDYACVSIGGMLYGLDHNSFWQFDSNHFNDVGQRIKALLLRAKGAALLGAAHAVAPKTPFGDWLWMWITDDAGESEPNVVAVYDTRTQGWALWDGLACSVSATVAAPDQREIVWCGTLGGVVFTVEEDLNGVKQWQDYDGASVWAEYMTGPIGIIPEEDGGTEHKIWIWLEVTTEKHTAGKVSPITIEVFRDVDNLDGAAFTSVSYTPQTSGETVRTVRLWLPKAVVARSIFIKVKAVGADQELILNHIRCAYSPAGRRMQ